MRNDRRLRSAVSFLVLLFAAPVLAKSDPKKEKLEHDLIQVYQLTKTGTDRLRIIDPGTLLVVRGDGIGGTPSSDMTMLANTLRDGRIHHASGFDAFLTNKKNTRVFKPDEKLYVIDVKVRDDGVRFLLISSDTFEATVKGSTQQTRYKAVVDVEIPEVELQAATVESVKALLDPVLALEREASAPKTVELGQTVEEVESILGKPSKIVKAGPKTIYVYSDLKVVFQDGKVSDVE